MSRQQRIDAAYGRRGGGWSDSTVNTGKAPRCSVCGLPMVAGQRERHGVCSPPMPCCGAYSDLVPDLKLHAKQHAQVNSGR